MPDVLRFGRVISHVRKLDDPLRARGMREISWVERFGSIETINGEWTRLGGFEKRRGGGVEGGKGESELAGAHTPVNCAELDNGRDLDELNFIKSSCQFQFAAQGDRR